MTELSEADYVLIFEYGHYLLLWELPYPTPTLEKLHQGFLSACFIPHLMAIK